MSRTSSRASQACVDSLEPRRLLTALRFAPSTPAHEPQLSRAARTAGTIERYGLEVGTLYNFAESAVVLGAVDGGIDGPQVVIVPRTLTFGETADVAAVVGASDDDADRRIVGTALDDTIYGGAGRDTIHGGAGGDLIFGGLGRDKLYGDDGADRIHGEAGGDWLYGGAGADELFGERGDDRIDGGADVDRLNGGSNNDVLIAEPRVVEHLFGSRGTDSVEGDASLDFLWSVERTA